MAYDKKLGYDPDIKDYSLLIANTSDPVQRQEYLTQRQNKINDLASKNRLGYVPSNDLVATWTTNYTPGAWDESAGRYSSVSPNPAKSVGAPVQAAPAIDIAGLYRAIEAQKIKALNLAKEAYRQKLESQIPEIDSQYDALNANAQKNASKTALGDAEKLAVLGLGGNAYAPPQSGYSETSRVKLDDTLRSDINANEAARTLAKNTIANAIIANSYATDIDIANSIADLALKSIDDMQEQLNAERSYGLDLAKLTGYINGIQTLDGASQSLKADKSRFEEALERWNTLGVVLQSDADILGVPAGTPTSNEAYRQAQLKLARMKISQ